MWGWRWKLRHGCEFKIGYPDTGRGHLPSPSWLSIAILSIIAHNYAVESNLHSQSVSAVLFWIVIKHYI